MHKVLGFISLAVTLFGLIVQFAGNDRSVNVSPGFSLNHLRPQHKYWMLESYMDSILEYKSIARNSFDPMVQNAILLRIEEDTFYTSGTLNSAQTKKVAVNVLGTLKGSMDIQFFVEIMGNRISATLQDEGNRKIYNYLPITEAEYIALIHPDDVNPLQQGMNKYLSEKLFAGEYQSLDHKSTTMSLDKEGLMKGFKGYNKFAVHDYFGTSHPFQGLDVIWFESKNKRGVYYNWKFNSDTLILTEMLTKNKEEYFLGKKCFKFIKLPAII